MNTTADIARYHRTLSAARALRAAYFAALTRNDSPARVEAARTHADSAWSQYASLCRQHGLLAAHS